MKRARFIKNLVCTILLIRCICIFRLVYLLVYVNYMFYIVLYSHTCNTIV